MARVLLDRISKQFGNVSVLRDIRLEIEDREFLVILGPSGCGKSTLLRLIAGLERPSAGRIWVGDRDVTDLEPQARNIAMVFQNYALYPHMSVYDNMAFGLKLRHVPRPEIDRRVREAAQILGLQELLDRKPRALSGGQRQRVALGRAIVREPAVFLMDEPLSNLDAQLRGQTRVELKRLHERLAATVIYVTHDQTEAMTLGSRIVVLNQGQIQQVGTPDEIYRHPANRFVAAFVGTPSMNFLPVSLERRGGSLWGVPGQATAAEAIALPAALAATSASQVVLGIRPEDLELGGSGEGIRLSGVVRLVEPLGHETLVHLQLAGGDLLVSRTANDWAGAVGEPVTATVAASRLHLFDAETGDALALPNQPEPVGAPS